jgi:hypothetical protein
LAGFLAARRRRRWTSAQGSSPSSSQLDLREGLSADDRWRFRIKVKRRNLNHSGFFFFFLKSKERKIKQTDLFS